MKRYRWILAATAGILLVMLGVSVLNTPKPLETVHIVQAAQENVYNSISVKGTVQAKREAQEFVYAPARAEECYAASGDTVKAGQPLLRVSYPDVVGEDARQAMANLMEDAANISISAESTMIEGTIVHASMDGTVAQMPEVGTLLLPGVPVVRIGDFSDLSIDARVPELYAADLKVGQRANVTPITPQAKTISATLHEIAPYAVQTFSLTGGKQSAVVKCSLKIAGQTLMPGTTVDVKVFTDTVPNAVTVPYAAVRQDGQQQYVYACRQDGTLMRRNIETGYQLSRGVQVKQGLQAGEWIVCDSNPELSDGQQVIFDAAD